MKNSLSDKIYIIVCLAVLLAPLAGMLVFGEARPAANEAPAPRPSLKNAGGSFNTRVLSEVQDYIAVRCFLRTESASVWAALNAGLLRTSVEDDVVLGSEGWLYYGRTVDDYMGLGLTDEQLTAAARNLALMQEYVLSRGARFVFTVAPNKNSLYPGHMPGRIPAGSGANRERLPALLEQAGVNYADLYAPFLSRGEILYYRTDSHWTNRGAALAADTLLASLGMASDWFNAGFAPVGGHRGDLYEMLFPAGDRTEPEAAPAFSHVTDADPNGGDAINIRTASPATGGALLCFRDSFGRALYPYLADSFAGALFSRQSAYDLTRMDELGADAVIIELVERNISQLITEAPVFPAPERDAPDAPEARSGVAVSSQPGSTAGTASLRRWYGELDADQGAPVYLLCAGRWYECCLLDAGEGRAGFSAWLPEDAGAPELVSAYLGGEPVSYFFL